MSATDCFVAWDEDAGTTRILTRQEMADNLMAGAKLLGRGTPAAGLLEQRAAEVARGGSAGYTTVAAARELGIAS